VGLLVGGDRVEVALLGAREQVLGLALLVEGGLEVLEGERVVEDVDVAAAKSAGVAIAQRVFSASSASGADTELV